MIDNEEYYILKIDNTLDLKDAFRQFQILGLMEEGAENQLSDYLNTNNINGLELSVKNNRILGYVDDILSEDIDIRDMGKLHSFKLSMLLEQQEKDIRYVKDNNSLADLNRFRRTRAVCLAAIETKPENIYYASDEVLDEKTLKHIFQNAGELIKYVDPERLTPEHCLIAVKNNAKAICCIPVHLLSEKICSEAVSKDFLCLYMIPEKFRTKELCKLAIDNAVKSGKLENYKILGSVPFPDVYLDGIKKFEKISKNSFVMNMNAVNTTAMNSEIADYLLKINVKYFAYIPDHLKTREMCFDIVRKNGSQISWVPDEFVTKELCYDAVKNSCKAMHYIPEEIRNYEFCKNAVELNSYSLMYMPREFVSKEMCELAIRNCKNDDILTFVPYPDLYSPAIDKSIKDGNLRKCLSSIQPELINEEIALKAVNSDPFCISMIPEEIKTRDICFAALNKDISMLEYIPDRFKSEEVCLNAIKQDEFTIVSIPDDLRTSEFYNKAVNVNPYCFGLIPMEFRTDELFSISINRKIESGDEHAKIFQILDNPEQCLKMIKETDNPSIITDIIFLMDDKLNKDIVLEAVSKHPACFALLPKKFKAKDICELAVRNCPRMIKETPVGIRSPEMYLQATKEGISIKDSIPERIISGSNIYSFNSKIENKIQDNLTYKQVEDLYNGYLVKINKVMTSSGLKENQWVKYNKEKSTLDLWPVKENQDVGKRMMLPAEKEIKGKKIP